MRLFWVPLAVAVGLLGLSIASNAVYRIEPGTPLHYAPNSNFGRDGEYLPIEAGFNVADVSRVSELNSLPPGIKGLVWVGQCDGVTARFLEAVRPYIGNPKLFGFYLMDNPDPRTIMHYVSHPCTAEHLKAESDWIHANSPGAKTFMVLMNLASSAKPWFDPSYNPARLHVDLFGLDPYPCRSELQGCDYDMIDRYVKAAQANGVARTQIIPIYQAFGGGAWRDEGGGSYILPTAEQERKMLSRWGMLVKKPVFDYAYSWGRQRQDSSLETAIDLRKVFASHNNAVVSIRSRGTSTGTPEPPKLGLAGLCSSARAHSSACVTSYAPKD